MGAPQFPRSAVPDLAADLDPTPGSSSLALLRRSGCEGLADRLRAVVAQQRPPTRRIVFGGHFSCGKSTLINSLIGRELLPTGELPETSVPCVLRSGPADRIYLVIGGIPAGLPFSTAAIARAVSLLDDAGEYRRAVHVVDWVVVCLRGGSPPPGVLWIDSPGINDTPAMTRRAAEVADGADVLVWVVSARQPLSQVEQEFLHGHVATNGAESLVFVVNVFLPEWTRAAWVSYVRNRADYFADRIADTGLVGDGEPTVVLACAPALGRAPDDFGGPELRALLATTSGAEAPSGRRHRAGRELEAIAEDVRQRIAAEQARVDRTRSARDRAEQQRHRFQQAVAGGLGGTLARYEAEVCHATDDVVKAINTPPLHGDGRYGALLNHRLVTIMGALADELAVEVDRCAAAHDLPPLAGRAMAELRSVLSPQTLPIPVPSVPATEGLPVVGAVLGGILGKLRVPGTGSAVGTASRAGTRSAVDASAEARTRAVAAANARAAGRAAAARLRWLRPVLLDLVVSPARSSPAGPAPAASASTVEALETLQGRLDLNAWALRRLTPVEMAG